MQEKNQVVTGIPRMLSSYMLTMTYCMATVCHKNLTVILPLILNCKIIIPCKIFVQYGSKYLHVISFGLCIWYAFDILICKNESFVTA